MYKEGDHFEKRGLLTGEFYFNNSTTGRTDHRLLLTLDDVYIFQGRYVPDIV